MIAATRKTVPIMGTWATIEVIGHDAGSGDVDARDAAIDRAFRWFRDVELTCSRFDPSSELSMLSRTVNVDTHVTELLFRAFEFACAVAAESGGAFDPTVGGHMIARGFDRHYLTAERVEAPPGAGDASWRDVVLDRDRQTIRLSRPLQLDLGAVAKGLAIDLAARELAPLTNYAIDAGGDLYVAGKNGEGDAWAIGVRHPRESDALLGTIRVSDCAVCTSGDYERRALEAGAHHLLDPTTGQPTRAVASATVVAPTAMVADAVGTAAFVLGVPRGLELCARSCVEGLLVSSDLEMTMTPGMRDAFHPHA